MADFNAEHKKEMGQFFDEGVHKVTITKIEFGETKDGKEFAEFSVEGENGEQGSARVWFTTDAAINFAFNTFRAIFVHNTVEKNRDKMRAMLDELKNTKELATKAQALVGKEAWYSNYRNTDRPYTAADGSTKYSYDRNITGYEPKPREVSTESKAIDTMGGGEVVEESKDEPFPFD